MLVLRRREGPERRSLSRSSRGVTSVLEPQPAPDAVDTIRPSIDTARPLPDAGGPSTEAPDSGGPGRAARRRPRWLDVLATVALVAAILYLHARVVRVAFITSGSMVPTINPGDRVVVALSAYAEEPPRRGDVIAVRAGTDGGYEVKRVIGVGGDVLLVGWGLVLRNGKPCNEPYVHQAMFPEDPVRVTLGEAQLFVMGDNRNSSEDSRDYGPVDESEVLGRVCWRILPLGRAGAVR